MRDIENPTDHNYRAKQLKKRYNTIRTTTEASRLDDVSRMTDLDGEIDPPIELVVDTYVKDAQWK